MNNVTSLTEIKSAKISSDFQKQDINFDIDKLRNACNEVLKIKGFDTGPGNAPINDFVRKKNSGQMDTNGDFASKGSVNFDFINSFLSHPYFELNFPKSLDRDQFASDSNTST